MAQKKDKFTEFFKSYASAEDQLDFRMAHVTVGEPLDVISSGSYVLNDALSSGGLPKGRLIQYYGPPGSGKTLMAMIAIKEAQLEDPEAEQLFIDAEQTFSPEWAEILGLDTSRIIIIDGETAVNGRSCFEMLLGIPKEDKKTHEYKGKSKDGLLDKIANKEFNINMIVLDSLGSIIPPGEDISKVGKMNISLLARFLTTTFRKLSIEVKKANVPFIIINHKKDNMDPYSINHTYSGGNTYSHFLSANVYFEAISRKDEQILDEKENKIGHGLRATIEKSKFGPWPRKCEFKVNFEIGIVNLHEEIAQLALDYDVVVKSSSLTHEYKDNKWVGAPKFISAIEEDEVLFKELVEEIKLARKKKLDDKRKEQENKLSNKENLDTDETNEEADIVETTEDEKPTKKRGRPKAKKD